MTRHLALLSLLLTTTVGIGCSSSPTPGPATDTAKAQATPKATPQQHDGRAIELTGADDMKFSVTEIKAAPGERLSVTLVNTGTTPKFSMGHNWVLVATDTDLPKFLYAAAEAVTADYVPPTMAADVLASTKLLGPGERDTVTFAAPTAPGRYEFLCSFPGHFQVGMRGVLIVG